MFSALPIWLYCKYSFLDSIKMYENNEVLVLTHVPYVICLLGEGSKSQILTCFVYYLKIDTFRFKLIIPSWSELSKKVQGTQDWH